MAKHKGTVEKVVESAADAAEELGAAATSFKESWNHVKKAQSKARPATRAAGKIGKSVIRATKSTARKATRLVKRDRR